MSQPLGASQNASRAAAAALRSEALQDVFGAGRKAIEQAGQYASMAYQSSATYASSDSGNYILQVFFYFLLYVFLLFLILVLVHFNVTPVFSFTPGGVGVIDIGGTSDDMVYWKDRKEPAAEEAVPKDDDELALYLFDKEFTFSIDLYVRRITDNTATKRLILYKGPAGSHVVDPNYINPIQSITSSVNQIGTNIQSYVSNPFASQPATQSQSTDLVEYMKDKSSMIVYLTETNNLVVTFFSGQGDTKIYSCPYIKNIPLYTPFRLSVVVESRTFSVYINGKQTFQRVMPSFVLNSTAASHRFYSSPLWANIPTKTIFSQNLHIWPRAISYSEVLNAQPALAREEDFELPPEAGSGTCS